MNVSGQHRLASAFASLFVAGLALLAGFIVVQAQEPAPAVSSPDQVIYTIRPSEADPAVKHFDEPNVVVVDRKAQADAPLAVFLPGTEGRPENVRLLLAVIASQGYRAIGLEYNDEPAVVQVCPHNPAAGCSGEFRQERIFGNADNSPVDNSVDESIEHRLVMLLRSLDRQHPDENWSRYLSGDAPDWSRIVISGLSQGAGMAAYIAKRKPVARVVLFSSPWDFHGAERTLAPWIAGPSVTPPERWFAEVHQRENTAELIGRAYRTLKIPGDHILIFNLDVPGGGRGPNPFHGSTVKLPGYVPQWRLLYGEAPAG